MRVYRLEPSWILEDLPVYGGCRSWVDLPDVPTNIEFVPVLSLDQYEPIRERFKSAVSNNSPAL